MEYPSNGELWNKAKTFGIIFIVVLIIVLVQTYHNREYLDTPYKDELNNRITMNFLSLIKQLSTNCCPYKTLDWAMLNLVKGAIH